MKRSGWVVPLRMPTMLRVTASTRSPATSRSRVTVPCFIWGAQRGAGLRPERDRGDARRGSLAPAHRAGLDEVLRRRGDIDHRRPAAGHDLLDLDRAVVAAGVVDEDDLAAHVLAVVVGGHARSGVDDLGPDVTRARVGEALRGDVRALPGPGGDLQLRVRGLPH